MNTHHTIIIGDARQMREIPDQSVHLVVTSPPYWQLKDYGKAEQIGFNDTYEAYINNLNLVWHECSRVLHCGCRLCINIGDQFARSVYYGRYKVIPIRTEVIKFCESAGFDYMGSIIWQKVTTCNTTGGATVMGSFPYPRNGILKLDYEFILVFKKYGKAPPVSRDIKEQSKLTTDEWNRYFTGHWQFPGEKQGDRHLAMFPEELPRRLIKMFSFTGDTVLDPFLGSGTTSLAAINLERNSVGYEINESYLPVIKDKVSYNQPGICSETGFSVINQPPEPGADYAEAVSKLPYVFRDTVMFKQEQDPKKQRYGSKIELDDAEQDVYYTVKEVISPVLVKLSGGMRVRLLGLRENPSKKAEAIQFIREKTRGQQVMLRFDRDRQEESGDLIGYLYLKNKTFINAHLLKEGLVEPDIVTEHRCQARFIKIHAGDER